MTIVCSAIVFTLLGGVQEKADGAKKPAGLEELLGVDAEAMRRDEFARLKAMAERYGVSVQARLQQRVEYLDAYCGLTDKQRRRLEIATRGPSRTTGKQLVRRVEATASIENHGNARQELKTIREEIDAALAKPFESSFWKKTIDSTLTDEQTAALERNQKLRDEFARKAWVFKAVDETDRNILLTAAQRDALIEQLTTWIQTNPIPAEQRGRRGAWRCIPEDVITKSLLPELDNLRRRNLIAIAPHRLRQQLSDRSKAP